MWNDEEYDNSPSTSDDFYSYNGSDFDEGWNADVFEDDPFRSEQESDLMDEWN